MPAALRAGEAVESVSVTSFQSSPVICCTWALHSTATSLPSLPPRKVYVGDQPQLVTR